MTKHKQDNTLLSHLTLGKEVSYKEHYAPELLQSVPRSLARDEIGLQGSMPFQGVDIWNAYELSWLNSKGKPQVAILRCKVPSTSPNLIESKSFKLYLNSFNQTRIGDYSALQQMLQTDLSACAGEDVNVELIKAKDFSQLSMGVLPGECIDDLDIHINTYQLNNELLTVSEERVSETLHSHILKSNCLITNQPDWASVLIRYEGKKINRESLLRYLVSFRQHNEFHEQCVERIFSDLMQICQAEKLTVYARYTRRGGLNINPFRSSYEQPYEDQRLARQ